MKQLMMTMLLAIVAMTATAQDKKAEGINEKYFDARVSELVYQLDMTNDQKTKAVLFAHRIQYLYNLKTPRIHLAGLDPTKNYRLRELNVRVGSEPSPLSGQVISGRLLIEQGLFLPLEKDYNSCVFELTAE